MAINFEIESQFAKDLKSLNNKAIELKVKNIIHILGDINSIYEISNIKKLMGSKNYFRIRLKSYRIGLKYENGVLVFVRILHRKNIYKKFP